MLRAGLALAIVALALVALKAKAETSDVPIDEALGGAPDPLTSFFATSVGNGSSGGNYGGLAGADQRCATLAAAADLPSATWAAYLSTAAIPARDRIGAGPWFNVNGVMIATDVASLHANGIPAGAVLDEYGAAVPLGEHDILTGSRQDGSLHSLGANCADYSSNDPGVFTSVGHADGGSVGDGGTMGDSVSVSWNAAHLTACDQAGLQSTAGAARLYCFATGASTRIFRDGFE